MARQLGWIGDQLVPTLKGVDGVQYLGLGAERKLSSDVGGRIASGIHVAVAHEAVEFDMRGLNALARAIGESVSEGRVDGGSWPREMGMYVDMRLPMVEVDNVDSRTEIYRAWVVVYPAAALGLLAVDLEGNDEAVREMEDAIRNGVSVSEALYLHRVAEYAALRWAGFRHGVNIDLITVQR